MSTQKSNRDGMRHVGGQFGCGGVGFVEESCSILKMIAGPEVINILLMSSVNPTWGTCSPERASSTKRAKHCLCVLNTQGRDYKGVYYGLYYFSWIQGS